MFFVQIHCNPSLAFRRRATHSRKISECTVTDIGWQFSVQPKCWRGRGGGILRKKPKFFLNTLYDRQRIEFDNFKNSWMRKYVYTTSSPTHEVVLCIFIFLLITFFLNYHFTIICHCLAALSLRIKLRDPQVVIIFSLNI